MQRSFAMSVALLALVLLSVAAPAKATSWPVAPNGSVVAITTIIPSHQNVTGRGKAVLIASPSGGAYVAVNLTSSLTNITMAHIHVLNASAGNPVVLGLLPQLTSRALVRLDPPVSYRGTFWFVTRFDSSNLVSGMSADGFFDLLGRGLLYVNVHTTAFPGGAVNGTLKCKPPCRFTLG